MTYEVIARKWRSQTLDELVGQGHISTTLTNALKNNKLHHALLFTGPRGTGKTSCARILAKSLRCENKNGGHPCNQCNDCQEIAAARSVNVSEIDGASNNGVEAIRELREGVTYRPSTGYYKIYIIDEVHMLSSGAFNALLKTLEEPPNHVVFILATTEVQKIPDTILSRCQRFDFRRISTQAIADHLQKICEAEQIKFDAPALWAIAKEADGSMRDGQSLLEQVIHFSDDKVTTTAVTESLGLTDRRLIFQTLSAWIHQDTDAVLDVLQQISVSGTNPLVFCKNLLEEIRNLLLVKVGVNESQQAAELLSLEKQESEEMKQLTLAVPEERIHWLFDQMLNASKDIRHSQDAHLVLEMLIIRLCNGGTAANTDVTTATTSAPKKTVKKKVQRVKVSTEKAAPPEPPKPAVESAPVENTEVFVTPEPAVESIPVENTEVVVTPKPAVESPEVPKPAVESIPSVQPKSDSPASHSDDLQAQWYELVQDIKKIDSVIGTQLENFSIRSAEAHQLHLAIPENMKFLFSKSEDSAFQNNLKEHVKSFWKWGEIKLNISLGTSDEDLLTPKKIDENKKKERTEKSLEKARQNPVAKMAQTLFKGEILSVDEDTSNH